MPQSNTNELLNYVAAVMERSLPSYLHYAKPARIQGDERAIEMLGHVATDQRELIDRICALLIEQGHAYARAEFPMEFTGLHDLSMEYLLTQSIELQQHDIAALQACVESLAEAPLAKAIAEEAVGLALGHLENMRDVAQELPSGVSS